MSAAMISKSLEEGMIEGVWYVGGSRQRSMLLIRILLSKPVLPKPCLPRIIQLKSSTHWTVVTVILVIISYAIRSPILLLRDCS